MKPRRVRHYNSQRSHNVKRSSLLLLALLVGTGCAKHAAASQPADTAIDVPTATAVLAPFEETVNAQGRVGAATGSDAKLVFATPGIVRNLYVHVGQTVEAGEALAQIDTGGLSFAAQQAAADAASAQAAFGGGAVGHSALVSAQAKAAAANAKLAALEHGGVGASADRLSAAAALRQSQLKLEADKRNLARVDTLYTGGVVAQKEVQAAQAQVDVDLQDLKATEAKDAASALAQTGTLAQARYDAAQAQSDLKVAQAQAGVQRASAASAGAKAASARRDLFNGTLRAPEAGVVVQILKKPGEAVDPTTPVVALGPRRVAGASLNVAASDIARVHVGDPVDIRVSETGAMSRGHVIGVVPSVDPTTQSAAVTVTGVPSSAPPGASLHAQIVVARDVALTVPTSAIVVDPQSEKTLVFVQQKDGSFSARPVLIRAGNGTDSAIGSGLKPGEKVAKQGAFDLLAPAGGGG
jgi:HlyD family secretion protein